MAPEILNLSLNVMSGITSVSEQPQITEINKRGGII